MSETIVAVLFWPVLSFLLNLALTKRSRIDAWAESKPRLAAVLKFLRGSGVDPWMLHQAATLAVHKRLPLAMTTPEAQAKRSLPPPPPPSARSGHPPILLMLALACLVVASQSACGPAPAPCSQADFQRGELALIVAGCAARRSQVCPDVGTDDDCPEVDKDCDAAIEARCGGAQ